MEKYPFLLHSRKRHFSRAHMQEKRFRGKKLVKSVIDEAVPQMQVYEIKEAKIVMLCIYNSSCGCLKLDSKLSRSSHAHVFVVCLWISFSMCRRETDRQTRRGTKRKRKERQFWKSICL